MAGARTAQIRLLLWGSQAGGAAKPSHRVTSAQPAASVISPL